MALGRLAVLCPPPSVVESSLFLFLLDAFDMFVLDVEENLACLVFLGGVSLHSRVVGALCPPPCVVKSHFFFVPAPCF